MKWQSVLRNLFLVILIGFTGLSCSKKLIETNLLFKQSAGNMLIAGDASEFKDQVREGLIELYKDEYNIDVVNIDKLKSVESQNYDLIVIMDTTMAWGGFNPSSKGFLDSAENRGKTVLFMTASDPDWEYSYKDIDAVTSASYVENVETALAALRKEIEHKRPVE